MAAASRGAEGAASRKVRFGVGLNTGECCVGNLGSVRRFDYSAIGDEVNVASRLEGASKMFGVDIVASEATRDEARGFAWVEIDEVLLKNKTRPVGVYALVGDEDYAASVEFREFAAAHDAMLADYRARRFEAARGRAADLGVRAPEWVRGLYFYNERRFAALIEEAPSQDWRALISLDEK